MRFGEGEWGGESQEEEEEEEEQSEKEAEQIECIGECEKEEWQEV